MSCELLLTGLDAANPLAYLAALGTLHTLTTQLPAHNVRMGWRVENAWRPVLTCDIDLDGDDLVNQLHTALSRMKAHPALARWDNTSKIPPEDYHRYASEAAQSASLFDRTWADFASALCCDAITQDGIVQDTAFRTMSGTGHQDFLKFMRRLVDTTTVDQLREALFGPWQYGDEPPSLRWDPADDRQHALRWTDPSTDPIRTVRGANRLAIEGLSMLPVMPVRSQPVTTGFRGRRSRDSYWTYPIWEPAVTLDVARSLLALDVLQVEPVNRVYLSAMGVTEVYRAQRINNGKYRNFTVGQAV